MEKFFFGLIVVVCHRFYRAFRFHWHCISTFHRKLGPYAIWNFLDSSHTSRIFGHDRLFVRIFSFVLLGFKHVRICLAFRFFSPFLLLKFFSKFLFLLHLSLFQKLVFFSYPSSCVRKGVVSIYYLLLIFLDILLIILFLWRHWIFMFRVFYVR